MSAVEHAAGFEFDAVLAEGGDAVGDDLGPAGTQGREEVAVGQQAHALIPRLVRRVEVQVDVVARGQRADRTLSQQLAHRRRPPLRELVDQAWR